MLDINKYISIYTTATTTTCTRIIRTTTRTVETFGVRERISELAPAEKYNIQMSDEVPPETIEAQGEEAK